MERPVKGDVVVVPFPFSDLSFSKRRPALVLAALNGNDLVLCEITSKKIADSYSIPLVSSDFVSGGLKHKSTIRVNKIFTADKAIVLYRVGTLSIQKAGKITELVCKIFRE